MTIPLFFNIFENSLDQISIFWVHLLQLIKKTYTFYHTNELICMYNIKFQYLQSTPYI